MEISSLIGRLSSDVNLLKENLTKDNYKQISKKNSIIQDYEQEL